MSFVKMRICKSVAFDAAHFLEDGAHERPYARMHGHSFVLEAQLEGEVDPKIGWVADFADLEAALADVRASLDHRLLNEVEGLERPTLENICAWVAARLRGRFPTLKQVRVARPSNGESCTLDV